MTELKLNTLLGDIWDHHLHASWRCLLADEWSNQKFRELTWFLDAEYQHQTVLPEAELIFNAFNLTPFDAVKVIVLGQDPYPNPEYAHGLAFSVRPGVRVPLSLNNIFRELSTDLGVALRHNGSLIDWAQQGVFLLNTSLTTRAHEPGSHANHGWEQLTDRVIQLLSEKKQNLVFILWGAHAIHKKALIDHTKHLVLCSSHPAFRSVNRSCGIHPPFRDSKPFSQTNEYLIAHNKTPVKWVDIEE